MVISKLTTVFKLENGVSTLVSFYKRVNRRFGLRHLRRYVVTEPLSPSSIEVHSHFSDVLQNSRTALDLTGTNGTKTKHKIIIKKSVLFHPPGVLLPFGGRRSIILL